MEINLINLKKSLGIVLLCFSLMLLLPAVVLAESEHEAAVKTKIAPVDRGETEADAQFRKAMHMTYMGDAASTYGSGADLYHTLTVTGEAIGERQVYAVREIEELASLSMKNQAMHALMLPASGIYTVAEGKSENTVERNFAGLDLVKFLSLCGVPLDTQDEIYVQFYGGADVSRPDATLTWRELQAYSKAEAGTPALLAFGLYNNKPLVKDAASPGYSDCCGNTGGPLRVVIPRLGEGTLCIDDVGKILVGKTAGAADPRYDLHNRAPFSDSLDKTFTVNIYDSGAGENTGPLKTQSFTTAQLEQLTLDHPEHAVGNYYGLIGDRHSMNSMGLGAWLDYYEGIDLWWLLEDQVGLPSVQGRAVFYDREGLAYTTVDDLRYLNNRSGSYSKYTITTQETVDIPNAVPMIAFSKNGFPLLPEHVHEGPGYYDYNQLNQALMAAGVPSEVGAVKNSKGPFAACLGNVDNFYGGYQVETAGDCVRIDLYLDLPQKFADVQGHWAQDAISFVLSQDLFQGASDHTFDADSPMTRGMLVTVLGRLAGADAAARTDFADVPATAYYAPYVAWAADLGLVNGVSEGRFAPDQPVTRQELAVILTNFVRGRGISCTAAGGTAFADEQAIASWAKSSVQSINACGIMGGDGENRFCPLHNASRAEVAAVLMRLVSLEKAGGRDQ
ncbi:S-layer homology domain-containing protein [Candidatus Formimonas warabiya]|uniref:SLH domain-containing protein n=1 Tax=Formimonas warabiya TaxID=1761012 RepID=A0A3G1KT12_FORW1|nr:S-layer homology domain-containing protein [Candidatus Formimonas warabiya]ATW25589.1 hypothetical protein DCMF_13220 [Candidatus Formimonas warabiya]